MKKLKLFYSLLALAGLTVACSDDDSSSTNNNAAVIAEVTNTVQQGTWRVTNFTDNGINETATFNGYTFTFGSNGILTAVKDSNTHTGMWSVTADDSNDDNPSNDIDFNIAFGSPVDFIDLNDDWDITERNANKISLIDISGGNGGTDILIFEKN